MKTVAIAVVAVLRTLLLLLFATIGTIYLVRYAPGYFSDTREMDGRYEQNARNDLSIEHEQSDSASAVLLREFRGWLHGDLGQSRQYHVPVTELIGPRVAVSGRLLMRGIGYGWILACCIALPVSALRRGGQLVATPLTLLLAVPTGALATACILAQTGGPVLVLAVLVAVRDFKFLHCILLDGWRSPHILHARAQGVSFTGLLSNHILPNFFPQILAVARLSLVTSLGAMVPIEVIFNVPGVGQLAWAAVMNRDLPVLMAVTLIMAALISCTGIFSQQLSTMETA